MRPGRIRRCKKPRRRRKQSYLEALSNDLNTAEARAPIFDLIRAANTAIDQGNALLTTATRFSPCLPDFDAVFDVIEDSDAEPTRRALGVGRDRPGGWPMWLRNCLPRNRLPMRRSTRWWPSALLAKKQRNFARADQIRNELAEKGIVIEDSKDGVRWKRK